MTKKNRPIGIFDSGIGGLTVVKEIIKELPNEDIVYFGDTARVPYGNKSAQTVINFSLENDPEIDEEWITLNVTVEGEIEEILDKYDKYTDNFVYEIPWPERDRIRFSYNII